VEYNDYRWRQRFANFENTYLKFKEAILIDELNDLEKDGLVQRFEYSIELSWKLLKDYLVSEGFSFTPTPKETIREAFRAGIVNDGQVLIDAIELRNSLSHDYSGEKFYASETLIRNTYFPVIEHLYNYFKSKI
jgi:nucleotidyltransferase substrate binding protein (TIGR01987 family)